MGLEAGRWHSPSDFAPDELRNNFRGWPQAAQKANREIPTHRPNASSPMSPRQAIHPMMNGVGGTTLHYWAQSWRLSDWDFKVVSETTRRYGASRIPKGSTIEDWPLDLAELEPFYDAVEYEIGVSGKAGNIGGAIDRGGNIFEGPRRREYPMPPLRSTGFTDMMADAARKIGWHAFPGPAAINSEAYQNAAACMYHGFCNRGGCHVSAKNSTAVTTIPKAQATGGSRSSPRRRSPRSTSMRMAVSPVSRTSRTAARYPACVRRASRRIRVRERSRAPPVQIARVPERSVEQSRAGRPALFQPQPGRGRARACSRTT